MDIVGPNACSVGQEGLLDDPINFLGPREWFRESLPFDDLGEMHGPLAQVHLHPAVEEELPRRISEFCFYPFGREEFHSWARPGSIAQPKMDQWVQLFKSQLNTFFTGQMLASYCFMIHLLLLTGIIQSWKQSNTSNRLSVALNGLTNE